VRICYLLTGVTPKKRDFDYPSNLTRTRAREDLLEAYRTSNRDLVRHELGGNMCCAFYRIAVLQSPEDTLGIPEQPESDLELDHTGDVRQYNNTIVCFGVIFGMYCRCPLFHQA